VLSLRVIRIFLVAEYLVFMVIIYRKVLLEKSYRSNLHFKAKTVISTEIMQRFLAVVVLAAVASPLVNAQSTPSCFSTADKANCDIICPSIHYSIFAKGVCEQVNGLTGSLASSCQFVCQSTPYIWTTVFIIVVWAAAVTILVFMLPLCVTSCSSCLTVKKEKTRNKQRAQQQQMEAGTYDVAVPQKGGQVNGQVAQQGQQAYNPYMYWPYYGRM
jgi:hypothetical protein